MYTYIYIYIYIYIWPDADFRGDLMNPRRRRREIISATHCHSTYH